MAKELKVSFESMKRLKVKSSQSLLFIFIFFYSLNVNAVIVSHCFNRPIQIECVPGMDDKFSLEGEYIIKVNGKNQKYEFFSRRAWGENWCPSAFKQVKHVMSNGKFCIEGDVTDSEDRLMPLEGFFSSKSQWIYFDEHKPQSKTVAQLQETKTKSLLKEQVKSK